MQKKAAKISKPYERFGLGNLGAASQDSLHLHPVQSIHRRTVREMYRGQVKRTMLPEQG